MRMVEIRKRKKKKLGVVRRDALDQEQMKTQGTNRCGSEKNTANR